MSSPRVFVFGMPVKRGNAAVVYWIDPRVTLDMLNESIRTWSEKNAPVSQICLLTTWLSKDLATEALKDRYVLRINEDDQAWACVFTKDATWEWLTEKPFQVSSILSAGYETIFKTRDGILVAPNGYHYDKPSSKHSKKFLRAGNVLVNSTESSFFSLGILDGIDKSFLTSIQVVYTDTSAINTVGHIISEILLASNKTLFPCPIISFGSYEGIKAGFEFEEKDNCLVIISASSSGGLETVLRRQGIDSKRIISLFAANKLNGSKILFNSSDLSEEPFGPIQNFDANHCDLCNQHFSIIKITGDHFLPESPVVRHFDIRSDTLSKQSKQTLDAFVGKKRFICNPFVGGTRQLASLRLFREKKPCVGEESIKMRFRRFMGPNPGKVFVPPDSNYLKSSLEEMGAAGSSDFRNFLELDIVPFFIDVNLGGNEAVTMALRLRRATPDHYRKILLGVSIMEKPDNLDELKKNLAYRDTEDPHSLDSVYEIFLPRVPERQNRWIEESIFWDSISDLFPEGGVVSDRLQLLRDGDSHFSGLVNGVFLPNFQNRQIGSTPGLAFWKDKSIKGSQADVFVTIAAVLQERRNSKKSWGNMHNMEVFSPSMFFRFTDPVIQAAFLRNLTPVELNYSASEEYSGRFFDVLKYITSKRLDFEGGAASEFCYAILSQNVHLTLNVHAECLRLIESLSPTEAWGKVFAELARLKLNAKN